MEDEKKIDVAPDDDFEGWWLIGLTNGTDDIGEDDSDDGYVGVWEGKADEFVDALMELVMERARRRARAR
jgi:hypothetical protein